MLRNYNFMLILLWCCFFPIHGIAHTVTSIHSLTTKGSKKAGFISNITGQEAVDLYHKAKAYAESHSHDPRTKVGALLLNKFTKDVISQGYNKFPSGVVETEDRWQSPMKYKFVQHAEVTAIINAVRNGVVISDSVAVVSLFPCTSCAGALIETGIRTIISLKPDIQNPRWGAEFNISLKMFEEVGTKLILIDESIITGI